MVYKSFFHLLNDRVKDNPNKTAFIYLKNKNLEEEKVTYLELETKAKIIAAKLQTVTKKGDRVLLLYPPGLDFVYAYLGCLYAGVIAVPTYPPDPTRFRKTLPRLRSIIDSANADVVLTIKQITNLFPVMFVLSPELRKLKWISTDKLKPSLLSDWKRPNISTDEVAFLQYTSGSTSAPKGVMVTHKNLIYNSEAINKITNHDEVPVYVCWLPNYHDMGLIGGILQPLYGNFLGVLMSPLTFLKSPITWLKAISKYKGTATPFPNFALDLCIRKIKEEELIGIDLSSWSIGCNGAETIRKKTLDAFSNKFSKYGYQSKTMYPAYGLAEATLIASGGPKDDLYNHINISKSNLENNLIKLNPKTEADSLTIVGCGNGIQDQEIRIVNKDTKEECHKNEVGEIWLSSPCVAKGYWNNPKKTKETFEAYISKTNEGPYLRTGDLGFLHNNELYITGRIKDMLIIRGVNHYPQDIELTVQNLNTEYPAIRPGCTIACSVNIDNHEQLVIFQEIDKKRHKNANKKEKYDPKLIIDAIRRKVNIDHQVQTFGIFLIKNGTIPKTSSGKIMRHACKVFVESNFKTGSIKVIEKSLLNKNNLITEIKTPEPEILPEIKLENNSNNIVNKLDSNNRFKEISEWLINWLNKECMVPISDIELEKNFNSYGLDSAKSLTMIHDLEIFLKEEKEINPIILWEFQNIKALAKHLSNTPVSEEIVEYNLKQKSKQNNISKDDIAVIGASCKLPGKVENLDDFWDLLINKINPISEIPKDRWDISEYYSENPIKKGKMNTKFGGFIDDITMFEPEFFNISPREAISLDPQQRILLELSWKAIENSFYTYDQFKGSNTGVFIGISSNDYSKLITKENIEIDAYAGTGNLNSVASGRISYFYDFKGPSLSVDTACSSSLYSIHLAAQSLKNNECETAIAGGINIILSPESHINLSKLKALSPNGKCKVFDKKADGYVRSEGGGLVILKTLEKAISDNDNILGVIKASSINHDGNSNGLTAPNIKAQEELIKTNLNKANLKPSDINYFETHGTGTPLGDPIELKAIEKVFVNQVNNLLVGSVKSNLGHLEAASGITSFIKALLCLKNNSISPNLHFEELNENIPNKKLKFIIPTEKVKIDSEPSKIKNIAINSFGFSGTNVNVILSNFNNKETEIKPIKENILNISAKSEASLLKITEAYYKKINNLNNDEIDIFCNSVNTKRTNHKYRFSFDISNKNNLESTFESVLSKNYNQIYQGECNFKNKKTAFIFSGQGTQWYGMGKELYLNEPIFKKQIDFLSEKFENYNSDLSIVNLINNKEAYHLIDKTSFSQPLIFCIHLALSSLLKSYGIKPNAVLGHSLGEISAAYISESISLDDAIKIVYYRSKLMEKSFDKGRMISVKLSSKEVKDLLLSEKINLSIAAINSNDKTVLSGNTEEINKTISILEKNGSEYKLLPVKYGFHSYLLEKTTDLLEEKINNIKGKISKIPFYSSLKGKMVEGTLLNQKYWVSNMRDTVNFLDANNKLFKKSFNVFIEISPTSVLLHNIIKNSHKFDRNNLFIPTSKKENEKNTFFSALSNLYVNGFDLNLKKYLNSNNKNNLPNYIWNKSRYMITDFKNNDLVFNDWQKAYQYMEKNKLKKFILEYKNETIILQELNSSPSYKFNKNDNQTLNNEKEDINNSFIHDLNKIESESEKISFIKIKIKEQLSSVLKIDINKIDSSKSLSDLGLDSLMLLELKNILEKIIKIEIPNVLLDEYQDINDLAKLVLNVIENYG